MDLTHRFRVPAPLDETWTAFRHVDRVATAFPGATVTAVDGDSFTGLVKIKFGPIGLSYDGSGRYVTVDPSTHTMVLQAEASDRRGNGTGKATVTATFSKDHHATAVEVHTDLTLTGRAGQLGRGVVSDISERLAQQFAETLAVRMAEQGGKLAPTAVGASGGGAAGSAGVAAGTTRLKPPSNLSEPHIDIFRTLSPLLLKRVAPVLGGVFVLVWLISRLARRKH